MVIPYRPFGHAVHHPKHCLVIQRKCQELGIDCAFHFNPEDNKQENEEILQEMVQFFLKHLEKE